MASTGRSASFYGEDTDDGKPVLVRFRWTKVSHDHLRWEQSFSYDGGKTWEMNWTNELTRTKASACDEGRPRKMAPVATPGIRPATAGSSH